MSSGRTHFIALSGNRQDVWTWDERRQFQKGVKLNLVNPDTHASLIDTEHTVSKVRAGWGLSSCLINGVGIVVWNSREGVPNEHQTSVFGPADASVTVIEDTKQNKVADYIVLEGYILYITYHGELMKVKLNNNDLGKVASIPNSGRLEKFHKYVESHSDTLSSPSFVRISGNFNKFAVMTNDDQVLLGNSHDFLPVVHPELQHNSIISMAVGDYHYLALNKKGEVYTWGRESDINGCLGNLGSLKEILDSGVGVMDGRSLVVEHPTKIKLPHDGVALAIAAGGWHSASLVGC
ncbi:unnamed protein product [Ambrosiozyma monospora]|uniref:Unnamed protein product n=1 Tax=Ambrosiozyma monospora TaxID=43982 RepID=A0ACB5T8D9_AMBMO|nr:unnamed protein product [Ambrosiozyma monospora]